MPLYYLRKLTGKKRTARANRQLGLTLAFVAGATNAGGFLAVAQYTSHMTGMVSSLADNLALGQLPLALAGLGALLSFIAGAGYSTICINWGRHRHLHSEYAAPLLAEATLLLGFGLIGGNLDLQQGGYVVPVTVMFLCFLMGLQNAIITKISNAEIRTTHMTGIVTDIGIELGKAFYFNSEPESPSYKQVHANVPKLKLLIMLLSAFALGGLMGALGFKHIGFTSTLPLAAMLVLLAIVPVVDDMRTGVHLRARMRGRK